LKIDLIAGTRPNFIKIAPIIDAINSAKIDGVNLSFRLIHTGQHYDKNMSQSFFDQLGIPNPHFNLSAGGGSQAVQTAAIMIGYENLLLKEKSDLCLVVGDVNSTMACAIVSQKLSVPVAHVEAGIRSGDWTMPEEINRLVTDAITNYFFTTTPEAKETILRSGVDGNNVFWVGNTMIDTLLTHRSKFKKPNFWDELDLKKGQYFVITLHRPANVDDESTLKRILFEIISNSHGLPLVFPVHPRTAKILNSLGIVHSQLHMIEPLSYLEFNYLVENTFAVITDSGGITEETTVLGIPCMTLRDNTERPETVKLGTNELIGTDPKAIKFALEKLFAGKWKKGSVPELWDGNSAKRIVSILNDLKIAK
jgi:UDP-N-acetylglucosamine 2-epimerase (non-hydrolysing)